MDRLVINAVIPNKASLLLSWKKTVFQQISLRKTLPGLQVSLQPCLTRLLRQYAKIRVDSLMGLLHHYLTWADSRLVRKVLMQSVGIMVINMIIYRATWWVSRPMGRSTAVFPWCPRSPDRSTWISVLHVVYRWVRTAPSVITQRHLELINVINMCQRNLMG